LLQFNDVGRPPQSAGPSLSALDYAKVIPSVVRIEGYDSEQGAERLDETGSLATAGRSRGESLTVGTGVVIDDKGCESSPTFTSPVRSPSST